MDTVALILYLALILFIGAGALWCSRCAGLPVCSRAGRADVRK